MARGNSASSCYEWQEDEEAVDRVAFGIDAEPVGGCRQGRVLPLFPLLKSKAAFQNRMATCGTAGAAGPQRNRE